MHDPHADCISAAGCKAAWRYARAHRMHDIDASDTLYLATHVHGDRRCLGRPACYCGSTSYSLQAVLSEPHQGEISSFAPLTRRPSKIRYAGEHTIEHSVQKRFLTTKCKNVPLVLIPLHEKLFVWVHSIVFVRELYFLPPRCYHLMFCHRAEAPRLETTFPIRVSPS